MTSLLIDCHLHTARGSSDSSLRLDELVESALANGINGVCITEHDYLWHDKQFDDEAREQGLIIVHGIEVSTEHGHVLAYGLQGYLSGIYQIDKLREEVDRVGGVLISAHPFRRSFDSVPNAKNFLGLRHPTMDEACSHPLFGKVDAIEGWNSGSTEQENEYAVAVAKQLGLPTTGGSDSHSAGSIGRCLTRFSTKVESLRDLIEGIRAGQCEGVDHRLAVH